MSMEAVSIFWATAFTPRISIAARLHSKLEFSFDRI
jgi:hypothetical protein